MVDGAATRLQEGGSGSGSGSDREHWALLRQRQQQQAQDQSLIQSRYQTQMREQSQAAAAAAAAAHLPNHHGSAPPDLLRDTMERPSASATNLRSAFRAHAGPGNIGRSVTPDQFDGRGALPLLLSPPPPPPPPPPSSRPSLPLSPSPSPSPRPPLPPRPTSPTSPCPASAAAAAAAAAVAPPPRPAGTGAITLDIDTTMAHGSRPFHPQRGSSPKSVPSAMPRRGQGIVFNHGFSGEPSSDTSEPTSAQPPRTATTPTPIRPRTRTMDAAMLASLAQRGPAVGHEFRHRVGSVSSSGSQPVLADEQRTPISGSEAVSYSSISSVRMPDVSTPSSAAKDKKPSKNRQPFHRQQSRRPVTSSHPSVDSLPYPVRSEDASRLILLMKRLGGQMRGELEYQGESQGPWHTGIAYIDADRGALMFDTGPAGPFHIPLVSDLRGCRIYMTGYPDTDKECIEVVPAQSGPEVLLCPLGLDELEYWLAALLCWQQLLPTATRPANGKPSSPGTTGGRGGGGGGAEVARRPNPSEETRLSNVIKIGSFMLWDKGHAASAAAVVDRSSTRDPQNPTMSWRRVSFALQDNGDFRLLTEAPKCILSVIELANLSRCAIQALDRTVLDEEYCIAIFPIYAPTATHLSIFRPVYLALESRIDFEVWFTLLRTIAVPELYQLADLHKDPDIPEIADVERGEGSTEVFRLEKVIRVRVTEAKIKTKPMPMPKPMPTGLESPPPDKYETMGHRMMDRRGSHDALTGNYLAEVILDGEVRARTMTKMETKNPFWREDCDFNDLPPTVQELSVVLKRVESGSSADAHARAAGPAQEIVCGTVTIALDQLEGGQPHEEWQPIVDASQQVIGSMLMRVSHEEHVALLSKEYEPLAEMLQRSPSSLTTQITSLVPGQLRYMSELLLNIFQASGQASEWLMALVEDEIDGIGSSTSMKKYRFSNRLRSNESVESPTERELLVRDISKSLAGEANLLFRGNTLLTQALEFHMRRLGREYLEEVLRDKIREINELDPDCEVDRSKLMLSGGDSDQHWNRLLQLTNEVWDCIADSADRIPTELRHILKYVRAVAEDRYGDFFRTVNYTSVSGFLFLRFICPAILSPKLFGLLRDHPKPRTQRTLTLIAKTLQKLSNVSTFGKREEYMEPMNRFLNAQRKVFRDFIDQVCGIPADRGHRALPPPYSTPVAILNRLGPSAREGFPSLPYLIDRARSFAALVKLWVDSRPLESKAGQADAEVQEFDDMCSQLQSRADACLAKVVEARSKATSRRESSHQLAELCEDASIAGRLSTLLHEDGEHDEDEDDGDGDGDITADGDGEGDGAEDGLMIIPGSPGSEGGPSLFSPSLAKDGFDGRRLHGVRQMAGTSGCIPAPMTAAAAHGKTKNGKMGRTILNGIMRMGGRAESPESKGQR